jgi:hypothetical protein
MFEKEIPYRGHVTLYAPDCCRVVRECLVGKVTYYNAFGPCAGFYDLALRPILTTSLPFILRETADQHPYRGEHYVDHRTTVGEVEILRHDGTSFLQSRHNGVEQHNGLWEIHFPDGSVVKTNMAVILSPLKGAPCSIAKPS